MRFSSRPAGLVLDYWVAMATLLGAGIVFAASPGGAEAQSTGEGRAIYERRCSVCHGDRGAGAYWASDSLVPSPRDFTRASPKALSREIMIDAVARGREGTAMTAWRSRLSPGQIDAVVDFIRSEFMSGQGGNSGSSASTSGVLFPGGLEGDAAKGGVFFHANCAECHGHAGDGRGRRAEMNVRKPLDFTAPRTRRAFDRSRLFASISRGVPGTTMAAWSTVLSSQQIADVAEYTYRAFIEGERAAVAQPAPSTADKDAGSRVFLQYCAYCHGQSGDGHTAAADVLDPKPRDFTRPPRLSVEQVAAAVRKGRAGTAMPSFAKVLSAADIAAVADHVAHGLAGQKGEGRRYHTVENGWPDHVARYGSAVPFALGELAADIPVSTLSAAQREGLELFKGACVSCHFGKRARRSETSVPHVGHAAVDYEKGPHDVPPETVGLMPVEREGRQLYQSACAQCHAADGSGRNWIGRFLEPAPAGFNSPRFRDLLASDAFVERTLRAPGGTSMPSFETVLSREQVEAIAAYVRRAFQTP